MRRPLRIENLALALVAVVAVGLSPTLASAQGYSSISECVQDGGGTAAECGAIVSGSESNPSEDDPSTGFSTGAAVAIGVGALALLALAALFLRRRRRRSTTQAQPPEEPLVPTRAPDEGAPAVQRPTQEGVALEASGSTDDEARSDTTTHDPGWYPNPDAPGQRYWDGQRWTDNYYPAETWSAPHATPKDVLWGLSLGFGTTGGVVGLLAIPVLAFYFPLGFGVGGLALAIAAANSKGDQAPWWAFIAVLGSVAALWLGIDAYNEFNDAQDGLNDAQRELENFLGP